MMRWAVVLACAAVVGGDASAKMTATQTVFNENVDRLRAFVGAQGHGDVDVETAVIRECGWSAGERFRSKGKDSAPPTFCSKMQTLGAN